MRIGDITTGATKLRLSMQSLLMLWDETKPVWNDATARNFEEKYILALEPKVKQTLEAMGRLANVLDKAQQECDPR